jgi:hypothetical protein
MGVKVPRKFIEKFKSLSRSLNFIKLNKNHFSYLNE